MIWVGQNNIAYFSLLVIYVCLKREKNHTLKTCAPDFSVLSMTKLYAKIKGAHAVSLFDFRYPVWQHTFVSPSAFSRRAVVSYWRKYVHEVLVNRLGGLSLPRKSVVRLTDRPDMTLDVYRGRKTTIQQQLFDFPKTWQV